MAGGLFLPKHREAAGAQVDGFAVALGGEEAGGEADGDAAGADHPVQHGASFRRKLRILLHAPDGAEHRPVEKGNEFLQRHFRERNVGGDGMEITVWFKAGLRRRGRGFAPFVQVADARLLRVLGGFEGSAVAQALLRQHRAGGRIRRVEDMVVQRGQFHRRMQGGRGGAADEKRRVQPAGRHFAAQFLHLEQGRGDEPAHADQGGVALFRGLQDGFLVDHHTQVHHLEAVAPQDDARDVLADVVDIALHCRVDDDRPLRGLLAGLHVRLQQGHRILHHLGRFHDLRKEHLPFAEATADFLHPRHERPLDYLHGRSQPLPGGIHGLRKALLPAG